MPVIDKLSAPVNCKVAYGVLGTSKYYNRRELPSNVTLVIINDPIINSIIKIKH